MPNYVKVVPSIAIAFVSYEQVILPPPGLHCDCSAAFHLHQTDCHVLTSLTFTLLCNMSPALKLLHWVAQNSLGRQAFPSAYLAYELSTHIATVTSAIGSSKATSATELGGTTHRACMLFKPAFLLMRRSVVLSNPSTVVTNLPWITNAPVSAMSAYADMRVCSLKSTPIATEQPS